MPRRRRWTASARWQLAGAQRSYYTLSATAREAIEVRRHQLPITLRERLRHEAEQGL